MLIVNYSVHTNEKKTKQNMVFHFPFYPVLEISQFCFLLPCQSTTKGFHVILLTSPPLSLMYKISLKLLFPRIHFQFFEILLLGMSSKFSWNKHLQNFYLRLDVLSLTVVTLISFGIFSLSDKVHFIPFQWYLDIHT